MAEDRGEEGGRQAARGALPVCVWLLVACGAPAPEATDARVQEQGPSVEADAGASVDGSAEGSMDAGLAADASLVGRDAARGETGTTPSEPDAASPAPMAPSTCENEGTPGATSDCLRPTQSPEHYVQEALRYFDTLDVDADRESVPRYSELVARWEWPPWLLLTGYGRQTMNNTATILRRIDPSTVPQRDCRAFERQPFARCYVRFEYEGGPCPIYEEFTFNDAGETTFIEAWSDLPGMLPMVDPSDVWAEGSGVSRLSTRVPGLGNAQGRIDLDSDWMQRAEEADADVAEFAKRARNQWWHWTTEYAAADEDFFARGCGW